MLKRSPVRGFFLQCDEKSDLLDTQGFPDSDRIPSVKGHVCHIISGIMATEERL